jgi:hypothetical protein
VRDAGGVLEVRDHVQELHGAAGRALLRVPPAQVLEVEAALAEAHADHARLGRAEGRRRADVRRQLHEHDVARVHEDAGDEVEPLLAAVGDDRLRGRGRDALRLRVLADRLHERAHAAGEHVLEGLRALAVEDLLRDGAEGGHGKGFGAGLAGGEGDDAGPLDERAHPPDGGEAHSARGRGEEGVVARHGGRV